MLKNKILATVSILSLGVALWCVASPKQIDVVTPPHAIYAKPEVVESTKTREQAKETITAADLKSYLTFLASDTCAGRKPGTAGWEAARNFVVDKFKTFGLSPVNQNYLQPFNAGPIRTENVIGFVPGSDRKFDNELIIVGAHLDHLGQRGNQTFYGADDNGSGSVSMLEVAQAVSQMKLKRTVVFMSFSAEEMGLLGSKHYVANPIFPLNNVVLMVNFDMIGYLKGQGSVEAIGVKDDFYKKIIQECNIGYPFNIKISSAISGGSDHAPFGRAGVPIVFLFTGIHNNYHRPTDTVEKVDFSGMQNIARFAFDVVTKTADWPTAIKAPVAPNRRLN